jgi:predicted GIY-YIG superfamily endonuclease
MIVYLLQSVPCERRTYVGYTLGTVEARLRKHNGERAGGAAQTAQARPWRVVVVVEGFRTQTECLQFEYAWRRVHRRRRFAYSVPGRRASLSCLMSLPRWSCNAPPAADVPLTVRWDDLTGGTA